MTRFDTKSLKIVCGLVIGLFSILAILLLGLAALPFGMNAANYHGNLVVMMFFSVVGIVIARLLLRSASKEREP